MKKYIEHVILFVVVVVTIDISYGIVCRYLTNNSKGGITEKINYITTSLDEDVVIMGSSRAAHHYDSQVLADSLGVTVYNAGFDGSGIIASYAFLKKILVYHKPQFILCDISGFDIYSDDNTKYLTHLKEHYSIVIRNVFSDIDPASPYKLQSNFYKYNSKLLRYVRDFFRPSDYFHLGYQPLYGNMKGDTDRKAVQSNLKIDATKQTYLKHFIELLRENDIKVAFVVSPSYKDSYGKDYWEPLKEICTMESVPFIDMEHISGLSDDYTKFQDIVHLNDKGAKLYSSILCGYLQTMLNI